MPLVVKWKEVSERSFSKGDLIVFLKNENSLKVRNDHRGRIVDINSQKIQVELLGKNPRIVSFATNLYNSIDYGWATTVHKSQGATLDKTLYLASPFDVRNLVYVAMTRHRKDVQVFGSQEEFGSLKTLVTQLSKVAEKMLAYDYLKDKDPALEDTETLWQGLQTGFEGLKQVGQHFKQEAVGLLNPRSETSLQAMSSSQVAVALCSDVLKYWEVRTTNQKERFEKNLLEFKDTIEKNSPHALQVFKQTYPGQQKTLDRLEKRLKPKTLENTQSQQDPVPLRGEKSDPLDPIEGPFYEARETRRGADLLEQRLEALKNELFPLLDEKKKASQKALNEERVGNTKASKTHDAFSPFPNLPLKNSQKDPSYPNKKESPQEKTPQKQLPRPPSRGQEQTPEPKPKSPLKPTHPPKERIDLQN